MIVVIIILLIIIIQPISRGLLCQDLPGSDIPRDSLYIYLLGESQPLVPVSVKYISRYYIILVIVILANINNNISSIIINSNNNHNNAHPDCAHVLRVSAPLISKLTNGCTCQLFL